MQSSQQQHHNSGTFENLYQSVADQYHEPLFQILDSNMLSSDIKPKDTDISFKTCNQQFITLESFSPSDHLYIPYTKSSQTAAIVVSNASPLSSHGSQSCSTNEADRYDYLDTNGLASCVPMWSQLKNMVPKLSINQLLVHSAQAVSDEDLSTVVALMDVLDQRVSISGNPVQRLGTYMLEGLRARIETSGSLIYKSLKCSEPTSSEMMSYMQVLYQICPYWKFAYVSANTAILEAVENDHKIHIVDFQIAQGTQWIDLIKALAVRQGGGGSPWLRITGVDDSESTYARNGGLHIIKEMLTNLAASYKLPLEFHELKMSNVKDLHKNLVIVPGEALIFNFPYVLHHIPDESVNTENYRDELLRMVKSLSPKILILVEQESNTNTAAFVQRFKETLDYYTAMFESIDVARSRFDTQRLNAEMHCVAKDIISMIACEGGERVERHELLAKWSARFNMAGFDQCLMSSGVGHCVKDMLKEFDSNYRLEERNGALFLKWKNRAMVTFSAWK